eukprot:tig00021348_g20503.t1
MPAHLAERLRESQEVAMVEEDKEVTINRPTGGGTTSPPPFPWNLDRVDSIERVYDGQYNVFADGTGVEVHVLDTGIRTTHSQFGGRAFVATTPSASLARPTTANTCPAEHRVPRVLLALTRGSVGHGTHCAGTVGGVTYGAAKNVKLIGTKVLNRRGAGSFASVIAGIDWVTARKQNNSAVPMVISMSLGGGAYEPIDTAVSTAVRAGVVAVVAAGNENSDACKILAARAANAITVGATDSTDTRASFSNFGPCVEIFAPGVSIPSAWYSSDTATNTISGTSMATPLVAGVFALYLSMNPGATPAEAAAYVLGAAAKDKCHPDSADAYAGAGALATLSVSLGAVNAAPTQNVCIA